MNQPTVSEHVWRNLLRLADRLSSAANGDCDLPNRLPLSQLRVVGIIYEHHPEGIMLKEIADQLKLTPGAISQTGDVLVRENLVERTASPSDRRAILLRPTAAGLELNEKHSLQIESTMQKISGNVAPEDFQTFSRVLAHLLDEMNKQLAISDK